MIKRKIILLPQEYVVLVEFGYLVYVFLVLLFQETFIDYLAFKYVGLDRT